MNLKILTAGTGFAKKCRSSSIIQFVTEIKGINPGLERAKAKFEISGLGSGTNFQCIIDYLEKDRSYDGLIFITDGYAPVPTILKSFSFLSHLSKSEVDVHK
jgi:predicted metal-dependent peptidase